MLLSDLVGIIYPIMIASKVIILVGILVYLRYRRKAKVSSLQR